MKLIWNIWWTSGIIEINKKLICIRHSIIQKKYIKKVNTIPEYRQYITEEQDYQFRLNSERHEGEKRGLEIGEQKQKEKTIIEMLKENFSVDVISKILKMPVEQVKKYKQRLDR